MDDQDLVHRISQLVSEEQELRLTRASRGRISDAERQRIEELEAQLDQCWDLLRRRQAREEFGEDPDQEAARPEEIVERYQQ